jgi:transcriptional regulator with XRE-family HTH domain
MIETFYIAIGRRLEILRHGSTDLSQKAFAELHGFGPTRYNNWAKGNQRIPVEAAEQLCDVYGLTLDYIYRGRIDGLSENARKLV